MSSDLAGTPLAAEKLPAFKPHHAAKHKLLREYMQVWLPKLGYTYDQVAVVDCFASAGRYREGQQGSPLHLLGAYTGREAGKELKAPPHFVFIEPKRTFAEHLQSEVNATSNLRGAKVDVIHGRYESRFPEVIEYLASTYRRPVPTFAFIDPLGWSDNPFELIGAYRRRLGEKVEVLVYVPASFMARFAEQDFAKASLERLYGGPSFEAAKEAGNEKGQLSAAERLAEAYRLRLKDEFEWATRFRIDPVRRNEYYLLFGTGHIAGLREMKAAMWKVDPVGGEAYEQDALTAVGHGQLFEFASVDALPEEESLPRLLRGHFESREFSIEEAEVFTLTQTRYLDRKHLRKLALDPLREAGRLEFAADRPPRKGQYPAGTRMRLV